VQALAARAGFGTPQRVATGVDSKRLALLLAVLDKRAGLSFAQLDVFCNIVGGLRVQEPVADAAIAAALASSVYDRPIPSDALILGELGLGGELRPVSQVERRLAEAARLGWRHAYLAERGVPARVPAGLTVHGVRTIDALLRALFHVGDQSTASPAA
jgi:DNA repair protein RadA/Sms